MLRLFASPVSDCGANDGDEIGRVASVERQREDFLVPDHLAHTGTLHIDERGGAFDGHRLFERADRQHGVNHRRGRHLEHDARLHVSAEPGE
jgi:hypothetical protein